MFDNYIIEVRSQAAGIVVRDGPRFRFFAANHAFNSLEGRVFRNPREAESAALRHLGTLATARHWRGAENCNPAIHSSRD
jgi:hypothetical protein